MINGISVCSMRLSSKACSPHGISPSFHGFQAHNETKLLWLRNKTKFFNKGVYSKRNQNKALCVETKRNFEIFLLRTTLDPSKLVLLHKELYYFRLQILVSHEIPVGYRDSAKVLFERIVLKCYSRGFSYPKSG